MNALNIRNMPPELMAKLKTQAHKSKMTLHDYCVHALASATHTTIVKVIRERKKVRRKPARKAVSKKKKTEKRPVKSAPVESGKEKQPTGERVQETARMGQQSRSGPDLHRSSVAPPIANAAPKAAKQNCPRCGTKLVPWGPMMRCKVCEQNYTQAQVA